MDRNNNYIAINQCGTRIKFGSQNSKALKPDNHKTLTIGNTVLEETVQQEKYYKIWTFLKKIQIIFQNFL